MLLILFGLAGAGKTFVGRFLADHYGFHHEDGDQWLTIEMLAAISNKKPFTQEMRDRFTGEVVKHIASLNTEYTDVVISQALYKQKNRDQILKKFPHAIFVQVDASDDVIFSRLIARSNEVDPKFANVIRKNFERMDVSFTIHNNDNEHIEGFNELSSIIQSRGYPPLVFRDRVISGVTEEEPAVGTDIIQRCSAPPNTLLLKTSENDKQLIPAMTLEVGPLHYDLLIYTSICSAGLTKFIEIKESTFYIFSKIIPVLDESICSNMPYACPSERVWTGLHFASTLMFAWTMPGSNSIKTLSKLLYPLLSSASYGLYHQYYTEFKYSFLGLQSKEAPIYFVVFDTVLKVLSTMPHIVITGNYDSNLPQIILQSVAVSSLNLLDHQEMSWPAYILGDVAIAIVLYKNTDNLISFRSEQNFGNIILTVSKIASLMAVSAFVHKATSQITDYFIGVFATDEAYRDEQIQKNGENNEALTDL